MLSPTFHTSFLTRKILKHIGQRLALNILGLNRSIIFFLPPSFSREVAETSPYYEALKKDDVEVGLNMSRYNITIIITITYFYRDLRMQDLCFAYIVRPLSNTLFIVTLGFVHV